MNRSKMIKNIAYISALIVQLVCISGHSMSKLNVQNEKPVIRFKPDGTLKIVNFSDLHYGEAPQTDWGPAADIKSSNVTMNILEMERPDFVVFTGDFLTAEEMFTNATDYFAILVAPLVERNYSRCFFKWASTYGNHDIGENMTRLELLEAEQKFEQSYTFQMNASLPGVTNYYLPIYPANEDADAPVMIWWFFDSQGGRTDDGKTGNGQQPEHIDAAVVAWFKDEQTKLNKQWGRQLPSLVFFHIPPIEFINVQEHIDANPLCSGLVDDDVTPQDNNTGIMQALWEAGGVQAIFVGHDHGNSWCCFYGQIQVCYNRHTGYGGYGTWTRGARIVNLHLDNLAEVSSYIRLEDGRIIDRFPKMDSNASRKSSHSLGNIAAFLIVSLFGERICNSSRFGLEEIY